MDHDPPNNREAISLRGGEVGHEEEFQRLDFYHHEGMVSTSHTLHRNRSLTTDIIVPVFSQCHTQLLGKRLRPNFIIQMRMLMTKIVMRVFARCSPSNATHCEHHPLQGDLSPHWGFLQHSRYIGKTMYMGKDALQYGFHVRNVYETITEDYSQHISIS